MIDPDEPKTVHTGRFNIGEENKENQAVVCRVKMMFENPGG